MRRILCIALPASLLAALGISLPAALAAPSAGGTKITLEKTAKYGKILANSRGFTIYAFTKDRRNHDRCQKIAGCSGIWPAVTTKGKPMAGPGVKQSLLGTIRLKDGKRQVTYNGHPLYTYAGDSRPHQTSYVNVSQFGGRWPAVNAKGHEVPK